MSQGYQFTDHERLVADLQAEDGQAVAWAYAKVFAGPVGQLILTHQLAEAGVGSPRDPKMTALERADHDGAARHALRLLTLAGYGRMSAAHAIAADVLEGQDHAILDDATRDERGHGSRERFSGPDGQFGGDLGPG